MTSSFRPGEENCDSSLCSSMDGVVEPTEVAELPSDEVLEGEVEEG